MWFVSNDYLIKSESPPSQRPHLTSYETSVRSVYGTLKTAFAAHPGLLRITCSDPGTAMCALGGVILHVLALVETRRSREPASVSMGLLLLVSYSSVRTHAGRMADAG